LSFIHSFEATWLHYFFCAIPLLSSVLGSWVPKRTSTFTSTKFGPSSSCISAWASRSSMTPGYTSARISFPSYRYIACVILSRSSYNYNGCSSELTLCPASSLPNLSLIRSHFCCSINFNSSKLGFFFLAAEFRDSSIRGSSLSSCLTV